MIELDFKDIELDEIKKTICQEGLIVIRNCNIDLQKFEQISEHLGKTLVTDKHTLNQKRTVQKLSNDGLFGSNDVDWHNDWSYGRGNYFGTILYNVSNANFSPTWFMDMSTLPQEFYKKYETQVGHYYPPADLHDSCFTTRQLALLKKQKIERSFVFNHPVTDETILYCSPGTIRDCDIDLSDIILYVNKHSYQHNWEENDILIWDNLKMMHKRSAFNGDRLLWRSQFII